MNYRQLSKQILEAIGGKENVSALAHCATRLRIVLKDESIVNKTILDELDVVKGTFSTGGQFQIILGTGIVNEVYRELATLIGMTEMSTNDVQEAATTKLNPFQQFLKMISDIFVPIIPAIVASGLLMGINNVLTSAGLFSFLEGKSIIEAYPQFTDLASMINTFANASFIFLPILLGFSATKRFGGNPFLGATLGMLMVHPDLLNTYSLSTPIVEETIPVWEIFGLSVEKVGYQGSVLPVLFSSYLLAKVEVNIRKIVPSFLDMLLTPLFTIFITGTLTFLVLGPLTREAGDLLTTGIMWLYDMLGPLGGALFGAFYAPFVITGMHHSFIAVETQLMADMVNTGGSFIFPIASMSNAAQGAAALAVFVFVKDRKTKSLASASGVSALLGITEPAMFGVNLKLRYPFYGAMIGSGVASGYLAWMKVKAVALGAAGVPGVISIVPGSMSSFVIGLLIAITVAFIATFVLLKINQRNK